MMTENAGAPVDNEMLAASVQMSTRTFTRAFARQVGTSPHQHLMKIRLDRAAVSWTGQTRVDRLLEAGDRILAAGVNFVTDGQLVRPIAD